MSQNVSDNFINTLKQSQKQTDFVVKIGWNKEIREDAGFFVLDSSKLDNNNFLKGSEDVITLFDTFKYSDESKFVKNFSISRKISQYAWGVISANAKITLNNKTGRFLPNNPEIGANFKAGRPVKIFVGYNGEMICVFTGFIGRPKVNIVSSTVELEAFDAMSYFETQEIQQSYFENQKIKDVLREVLIGRGFGEKQFKIDDSLTRVYPFLLTSEKTMGELFKEVAQNENTLIYADENGILNFLPSEKLAKNKISSWNFSYSNMTDLEIADSKIINSVKVKSSYLKEVGFGTPFKLEGEENSVGAKSKATFWLNLVDKAKYGLIGKNVEPTVIFKNSKDENGAVLNGLKVSGYSFGTKYKLEVENPLRTRAYLHEFSIPGRIIQEVEESPVVVQNIPSIEKYGLNPEENTGLAGNSMEYEIKISDRYGDNPQISERGVGGAMAKIGDGILRNMSEPNMQFTIKNFMAPHLQLADSVGLKVRDLNEQYNCAVLGVSLEGGVNANFRQGLYLQALPSMKLFILDSSRLDSGEILG